MNKRICKFIMTTMILILLTLICGQNCYSATGQTVNTPRSSGSSSGTSSTGGSGNTSGTGTSKSSTGTGTSSSSSGSGSSGKTLTQRFQGTSGDTTSGENLIQKVIGAVLSAVRIIATGIALIMITYLGIKYMSAAPNEKANIKNQLITFTIGAIVVFGTTKLLDIVKNFAVNSTNIP